MADRGETASTANYGIFRECVSKAVLQRPEQPSARYRRRRKSANPPSSWTESHDPEEMAEFIDQYIAGATFSSLPEEVQCLCFAALQANRALASKFADPIPQTTLDSLISTVDFRVSDTLCAYRLIPEPSEFPSFVHRVLGDYISAATAQPPTGNGTRATACEICGRDWIPLTDHHLIPKDVHAKAVKRNWHSEWEVNGVASLCRACHDFVHRMASNEELARQWYSVERILQREDVQDWARWASRLRWKAR